MKQTYKHNCKVCEFIETIVIAGCKHDVYRCEGKTSLGATWLARYGHRDGQYWSMPWTVLKKVDAARSGTPLLQEVARIASKREAE